MNDNPEWFSAKRYGYGSGWPITWQGWALSLGFIAIVVAATLVLPDRPLLLLSILLPLAAIFALVNAKTTRGGWRWRWGEED